MNLIYPTFTKLISGLFIVLFYSSFAFGQSDTWLSTLSATLAPNGQHTQLEWDQNPNTSYRIFKKTLTENSWSEVVNNLVAGKYIDPNSSLGIPVEYRLVDLANANVSSFVYAGNEVPLPINRGRILLLVDDTHSDALDDLLIQWKADAEGDGWTVIQENVSRTMPVPDVKAVIKSAYDDALGLKAVFIVGHVPVPYSGHQRPDGHSNHNGAWAADVYYAEMNEEWTDETVTTSGQPARTTNVPGDGKFDQISVDAAELEIGRVDFYDMPAFAETELELLQKYFVKNHAFKTKQFTPKMQAIAIDNFNAGYELPADVNFPVLVGEEYTTANYRNSLLNDSYIWSFGAGSGTYTSAGGISNTTNMATDSLQGVFTMLFGSYFGDWDTQNNFLRSALGSGTILTNTWGNRPSWTFFHMGMGTNIGLQARLTQSDKWYVNGFSRWVHIALLGDPTLRMMYVVPTSQVTATLEANNVKLNWDITSTDHAFEQFNIYRKYENELNYKRIGEVEVGIFEFIDDTFDKAGLASYMIRSQKLEVTPSGSYFNEGLGSQVMIQLPLLDQDGDGFTTDVDCDDSNEAINPAATELAYNGVDDDCDPMTLDDDLDGDGFGIATDCDDTNALIFPGAIELYNSGIDENCNGLIDEPDADGDGFDFDEDCNDYNIAINPDAFDIPANGIDENCDGVDGIPTGCTTFATGPWQTFINNGSCENPNTTIQMWSNESYSVLNLIDDQYYFFEFCEGYYASIWEASISIVQYNAANDSIGNLINSIEDCRIEFFFTEHEYFKDVIIIINDVNNCEAETVNINNGAGYFGCAIADFDNDGFPFGEDCNDANPFVNADAEEIPNNTIDENCDGIILIIDEDGDGSNSYDDCDDTNAMVNPMAEEIVYNGIDDDCDPMTVDDDLDGDGYGIVDDCDDTNEMVNPMAEEVVYNGIDDDCDPMTVDDDLDGDGYGIADDCDDTNGMVNPGAEEIPNNGIDEDCTGEDLITTTHELGYSSIKIFPNPATHYLRFETSEPLDIWIEMYDLNGHKIVDAQVKQSMSLEDIQNGIYLVKLIDIQSKQFVIQRLVISK